MSQEPSRPPYSARTLPRRRFVQGLAAGGVISSLAMRPAAVWSAQPPVPQPVLSGTDFHLTIGEAEVNFTGRIRRAVTVNGSLPAPLLRWREGSTVNLKVTNALPRGSVHGHQTSIHWHGIVLPANMDGVPGLSFDGIHRGESYQYRFDVRQAGTYWYHSHSSFQEQAGLYGPLVIDPAEPEPFSYQREHVVMLTDWTDLAPAALFARLKKMPGHDNYYRPTVGDLLRDARDMGLGAALAERSMWGAMRMNPADLSDVNAHTYTYLMNGITSAGNWTGLFRPGEKLRLRFINGSAMTYFDVRIPGLKMTVVAADGLYVHPVTVDEFRIAAAETLDVIVEPSGQEAFTVFAQDSARTGYVSGTLAAREGLRAPVPPLDPRPLVTMGDLGMVHPGAHGAATEAGAAGHDHGAAASHTAGRAMEGAEVAPVHPRSEAGNPLVDHQVPVAGPKLDDPGIGLRGNGRRVLTYAMLHSAFEDPDGREPGREIELHLTGHMEKFAWSFDGIPFGGSQPLRFNYGERLRIVLVNDTMMTHPIHLHGMWSDVEDEAGAFNLRKHTVDVPPGSRRCYRVRADALGSWAFHCHLLFHMEAGMMRTVKVEE